MTDDTSKPSSQSQATDAPAAGNGASIASDAKSEQPHPGSAPAPPKGDKVKRRRRLLIGLLGVAVLAAVIALATPSIRLALNTVSTDDAFVNGHVTFVAARVRGQVSRVLVDDNYRVHRGDLLIELDKEPYQDAVDVSRAAVETAKADLGVAIASVRGVEAEARSRRWKLQHAMEDVDNEVALLHARIAGVDKSKAALTLAQLEFDRAKQLVAKDNVSRSEFDRRQAELVTAQAELTQALADVHQIRAALGLPTQPEGGDLGQVPPDLDQTMSSVRQAQADLIQSAAQLGVTHSYNQTPKQMIAEFESLDPQGDIDRTFARLAAEAPAVKQAEARLEAAN